MTCSNNDTLLERFMSKVNKSNECWIWTGACNSQGYGTIQTAFKLSRAHRVSYELFKGPIPAGLWVLHSCDVPGCVNPEHLSIGTAAENAQDMVRKKRNANRSGALHPMAVLSHYDVKSIRASTLPGNNLADIYSVSQATISNIRHKKSWSYV